MKTGNAQCEYPIRECKVLLTRLKTSQQLDTRCEQPIPECKVLLTRLAEKSTIQRRTY